MLLRAVLALSRRKEPEVPSFYWLTSDLYESLVAHGLISRENPYYKPLPEAKRGADAAVLPLVDRSRRADPA
jgi:hypothetical protein